MYIFTVTVYYEVNRIDHWGQKFAGLNSQIETLNWFIKAKFRCGADTVQRRGVDAVTQSHVVFFGLFC